MANSTTNLDDISASQAQKETTANALFDAMSPASLFGRRASTCVGLTWGYYGGTADNGLTLETVANGTVALTGSTTNYVYADLLNSPTSWTVVTTTSIPAGWPRALTGSAIALYAVVTGTATVTSYTDYRTSGAGGTGISSYTSPLTTKGDLFGRSASADVRIPVGTDGYVLTADSANGNGVSWQAAGSSGVGSFLTRQSRYAIAVGNSQLSQLGFLFGTPSNLPTSGTVGSGSLMASLERVVLSSTSSGATGSSLTSGTANVWLGNAAGRGGFEVVIYWGVETTQSTMRTLAGLSTGTAANSITGSDPSNITDAIFMGCDSADTNMQIMHNDGSGTCTKVDLGASFPKTSGVYYKVVFTADSNGSTVDYAVTRLDSSATASGTLSTNLPANTVFMGIKISMSNAGTAAVASQSLVAIHSQTP